MEDIDGAGTEPTYHPFALTGLGGWPTSTQATRVISMYWSRTSMAGSSVPTVNSACRSILGSCNPFEEYSNRPYGPDTSPEDPQ